MRPIATFVYLSIAVACGEAAPTGAGIDTTVGSNKPTPILQVIGPVTLDPGHDIQFTIRAALPGGTELATPDVEWETSDSAILAISSEGLATPQSPGQVTISAHADGYAAATHAVVVLERPLLISLRIVHDSVLLVLPLGESLQLPIEALGRHGVIANPLIGDWSSSAPEVAEVDATGLVRAREPGYARIRVRSMEPGSAAAADMVIDVPPAGDPPFRISVTYDASISDERRDAVDEAVRRWQRIFTAPLEPVQLTGDVATDCPNLRTLTPYAPVPAGPESGVRIIAFEWQGVLGGGLGGTCQVRRDGTAVVGYIVFPPVPIPVGLPRILTVEVAMHEIAHALGLVGSLGTAWRSPWEANGRAWWFGPSAREGYLREFGERPDSIRLTNFHWSDAAVSFWENNPASSGVADVVAGNHGHPRVRHHITKVSVGALLDIGYPTAFVRAELIPPSPCPECPDYFCARVEKGSPLCP